MTIYSRVEENGAHTKERAMLLRSSFQQLLQALRASVACLLLLGITGCTQITRTTDCDPFPNPRPRIVVLAPEDKTRKTGLDMSGLSEMLITELAACNRFKVINMKVLASEHGITLSTKNEEVINTLIRLSHANIVAHTVVTGYDQKSQEFSGFFDWLFTLLKHEPKTEVKANAQVAVFKIGLDLRLVDSKTGQIISATSVDGKGTSSIAQTSAEGIKTERGPFVPTPRAGFNMKNNFDLHGTLRAAIRKAVQDLAAQAQAHHRVS